MRGFFGAMLLVLYGSVAVAGGGVKAETIRLTERQDASPRAVVVFGGRVDVSYTSWAPAKQGCLTWAQAPDVVADHEGMLAKNEYNVDAGRASGRCQIVQEVHLGDVEGLTLRVGVKPLTQKQIDGIPYGVKKALHLIVFDHNRPYELLAVSFDNMSDADLRRIAYEEGILRVLKYRED